MGGSKSDKEASDSKIDEGYEREDVNIPYIVAFAFICISSVVIAVFALDGYFVYAKEKLNKEVNQLDPKALNQLRAQENEILSNYAVLDKEKGLYRIPIARAMQLLSEEALVLKDENQAQ